MQKKPFKVKSGESRFGEVTKLFSSIPNDLKISGEDTEDQLSIFEYRGNEKGGPPLHMHHNQDEIFYVVEGEYQFQVGEDRLSMSKGDTVFLPRKIQHTFAQTSEHGKLLMLMLPSGKMESFFRKMGSLKSMPTPEDGAKIFEDHDVKVMGPPLAF